MARYFMGDTRLAGLERMMMDPSRTVPTRNTDTRRKRPQKKLDRYETFPKIKTDEDLGRFLVDTAYLSEGLTTILIDGQAPFASKTIPSVVDEICGRINQCVEETIANDRNNLSVQEVTSWQAARELKEYLEDGAHREAIDWFFRGSEPDGQFHSGYTLGNLPEATFMAWLQNPEGLVQTEADQHIKINQLELTNGTMIGKEQTT